MNSVEYIEFGQNGIGKVQAGPDQQERLEQFTQRVGSGEFHKYINWDDSYGKISLVRCVDGRSPETPSEQLAPNAAGGTLSLFVADDLTTKRFAGSDNSTISGFEKVVHHLSTKNFAIGDHTGNHAHGEITDCGANDKIDQIYKYIAERHDTLRNIASKIGIEAYDKCDLLIVNNAKSRTEFSDRNKIINVIRENSNAEFFEYLVGDHHEVIVTINNRPNTTLDRAAITEEFGSNYQSFNVDLWAFADAAASISESDSEVKQKLVAMTYFNLATALVIGGPKMRLVILG